MTHDRSYALNEAVEKIKPEKNSGFIFESITFAIPGQRTLQLSYQANWLDQLPVT